MPTTIRVDPKELIDYLERLSTRVADAIEKLQTIGGPVDVVVPSHLVPSIGPQPGFKCRRDEHKTDDQTLAEILVFVLDTFGTRGRKKGRKPARR